MKEYQERYVEALCSEMLLRRDYTSEQIETIYFGGGTPSQLSTEAVGKIVRCIFGTFNVALSEFTFEANPDDMTPEYARLLAGYGVNRVSLGAQTFDPGRLQFLHRRHSPEQVGGAVDALQRAGIDNISIDLMFGFPGETVSQWEEDIEYALRLDVDHISAYCLMREQGTPLSRMIESGEVVEPAEETIVEMYERLIDMLVDAGYEHYEISNFARKGRRSQHNSSYWRDVPYIGIGAAAHSYNGASREWNVADIERYVSSVERGRVDKQSETIDADTHYNDIVTTALRTCEGIDIDSLDDKYKKYISEQAKASIQNGLAEIHKGRLRLTRKGLMVSNMIMSDLVIA